LISPSRLEGFEPFESLREGAALNLAHRIFGNRGNQVDQLGHFEIGQAGPAVRLEFLCCGSTSEHHRGREFFAILRVRHSEYRDLGYRRILEQEGLDFLR
jgi:hypothetical protein